MAHGWFVIHDGLISAARLPALARAQPRISTVELLLLLGCGAAAAAAVGYAKLGLGIPGHSIVLAALPMAFGLSLAPRRFAGSVMGAGACGTALLLTTAGASYGSGAVISLSLLGPMMDVALRRVRSGRLGYVGLVLSGVATNLLALASRAAALRREQQEVLARQPAADPTPARPVHEPVQRGDQRDQPADVRHGSIIRNRSRTGSLHPPASRGTPRSRPRA